MIIKSQREHPIGEVVPDGGLTDINGFYFDIPFLVLEQITKQDYINECLEEDKKPGIFLENDKFYRISID